MTIPFEFGLTGAAPELLAARDALVLDLTRCVRCNACIDACRRTHADGHERLALRGPAVGDTLILVTACTNCVTAPCVPVCPTGALIRSEAGRVTLREEICIGCHLCEEVCPLDAIQIRVPRAPVMRRLRSVALAIGARLLSVLRGSAARRSSEFPSASDSGGSKREGKAVKCDGCGPLGGPRACEEACPTTALSRVAPP
jgi:Fe-S-cluster-containing dehydrogenase component